ncbi:hypothetical protein JMN32_13030 [Fulvivirga sp. 29W222]|uniref:Uncharacterized protein n=1 Tax=Fulvivirga marina TaxID=2494733 RepID=A0A937FWC2_9BACT|nr:hypothetical protein [Fulvivirga marina]MBL6447239.1 hypothetical protein [Fulvivirga marina]
MLSNDVLQTVSLIKKDLSLDQNALPESVTSIDDLKELLIPVINYLLDRDMPRLLNALYRIDISESKVKEILTVDNPSDIAPKLTTLIIERELQKVITRRKYSS